MSSSNVGFLSKIYSISVFINLSHNNPNINMSNFWWSYLSIKSMCHVLLVLFFMYIGLNPDNFSSSYSSTMFLRNILLWYMLPNFFKSCNKRQRFLRNLLMWDFSIFSTSTQSLSPKWQTTTNSCLPLYLLVHNYVYFVTSFFANGELQ